MDTSKQAVRKWKNVLVIVVGISDDKGLFPYLNGSLQDYHSVAFGMNFKRGYTMMYLDEKNKFCSSTDNTSKFDTSTVNQEPKFKMKWNTDEIRKFNDEIFQNLEQREKEIAADTKQIHYDGLIYFISGHGHSDNIFYDSDGNEINLEEQFFTRFNNKNCKYFYGIPKLFILDICCGTETKDIKTPDATKTQSITHIPHAEEKEDMRFIFSTASGYDAAHSNFGGYLTHAVINALTTKKNLKKSVSLNKVIKKIDKSINKKLIGSVIGQVIEDINCWSYDIKIKPKYVRKSEIKMGDSNSFVEMRIVETRDKNGKKIHFIPHRSCEHKRVCDTSDELLNKLHNDNRLKQFTEKNTILKMEKEMENVKIELKKWVREAIESNDAFQLNQWIEKQQVQVCQRHFDFVIDY